MNNIALAISGDVMAKVLFSVE